MRKFKPRVSRIGFQTGSNSTDTLDYRTVFENLPGMFLVLSPQLIILQASDAYLEATLTKREKITGQYLFDVFPDNPDDTSGSAVFETGKSMRYVLRNKKPHSMAVQRHDVRKKDGTFEEKYWSPINSPVLNKKNEVIYIIHRVEDVTAFMLLNRQQENKVVKAKELKAVARKMQSEIINRSKEIQRLNNELERKVRERTKELEEINRDLSDYKFALDVSSIVVVTDKDGFILHVNDNYCRMTKYKREELIGKNHSIVNSGYHSKEFMRQMWQTISKGKVWKGQFKNKAKDGSLYWVDTTIVPLLDANGQPYKYLAIRSDITERVGSQEKLKASEENYRSLYENSLVSVFTVDMRTLKPFMVNETGARLFGFRSIKDFLDNFNTPEHFANIADMESVVNDLIEQGKLENEVLELRRNNGSRFWAKIFVKLNDTKNIAQVVIVDITEQVRDKEELADKIQKLEIANKELESFNYISSHDLQEPLRKIKTFVGVLLEEEKDKLSDQGKFYLRRMSETSIKMQTLLNDLLDYSRVKNAPRVFDTADLNEVVKDVREQLSDLIKEKNAEINFKGLCATRIIRFQFQQLIGNLLSNALKFSDPSRKPHISISSVVASGNKLNPALLPEKKYCHISFTDNGIGFDPKYNERVFDIFERLNPYETYSGTGIGLAICKRIVENHNGIITANGDPGKGARFDIYLPADQ